MSENSTQQVQTESFICPNCGGSLRHSIKKDKFLCSSCGFEGELHTGDNTVDELDFREYARMEAQSTPFPGITVASCKNCGGQITFDENTTATVCPMCGSTQISQQKQKSGIPPEGIIPFKIDKQEAGQKFHQWIKGLWFAPNKLKKSYQAGNLTGRFVPFWTFDADAFATYTGEGGRYRKVKDDDGNEHTETDWFPATGVVQESFDDLLVIASTGDGVKDAEHVGPFNTKTDLRPYAPEYLAGYQAELYSIKANEGFETAKEQMESSLHSEATSDICRRFDTSRNVRVFPRYNNVTYKHILLPVWSSVFAYAGKPYRYLVNGSTGNVYGDRPFSLPKILAAVAVALAILIGGFALFTSDEESVPESVTPEEVIVEQTAMEYDNTCIYYL